MLLHYHRISGAQPSRPADGARRLALRPSLPCRGRAAAPSALSERPHASSSVPAPQSGAATAEDDLDDQGAERPRAGDAQPGQAPSSNARRAGATADEERSVTKLMVRLEGTREETAGALLAISSCHPAVQRVVLPSPTRPATWPAPMGAPALSKAAGPPRQPQHASGERVSGERVSGEPDASSAGQATALEPGQQMAMGQLLAVAAEMREMLRKAEEREASTPATCQPEAAVSPLAGDILELKDSMRKMTRRLAVWDPDQRGFMAGWDGKRPEVDADDQEDVMTELAEAMGVSTGQLRAERRLARVRAELDESQRALEEARAQLSSAEAGRLEAERRRRSAEGALAEARRTSQPNGTQGPWRAFKLAPAAAAQAVNIRRSADMSSEVVATITQEHCPIKFLPHTLTARDGRVFKKLHPSEYRRLMFSPGLKEEFDAKYEGWCVESLSNGIAVWQPDESVPSGGEAVTSTNAKPGLRVQRGKDWKWGEQVADAEGRVLGSTRGSSQPRVGRGKGGKDAGMGLGCWVTVAEGYMLVGDAARGPLKPGKLGKVVATGKSSIKVEADGCQWWYKRKAITPSPTPSPTPSQEAAARFPVGQHVRLTSEHARFSDASDGPLRPGNVGVVTELDTSTTPVKVFYCGKTWYKTGALEPVTSGEAPVASRFPLHSWVTLTDNYTTFSDAGSGPLKRTGPLAFGQVVKHATWQSQPVQVKCGDTTWWYAEGAIKPVADQTVRAQL